MYTEEVNKYITGWGWIEGLILNNNNRIYVTSCLCQTGFPFKHSTFPFPLNTYNENRFIRIKEKKKTLRVKLITRLIME